LKIPEKLKIDKWAASDKLAVKAAVKKDTEIKGDSSMKAMIEDTCTACGLCVDTCPDVFEMGSDMAQVTVDEVPAEFEDAVQQAADECPVEAIIIE